MVKAEPSYMIDPPPSGAARRRRAVSSAELAQILAAHRLYLDTGRKQGRRPADEPERRSDDRTQRR